VRRNKVLVGLDFDTLTIIFFPFGEDTGMPHSIDPVGPWRLSHILEGHSSDVKAVSASSVDEEIELIHTASRDETGRSWFRNKNQLESFQRGSSYQGNRYQNSVNYIKNTSEKGNGRFTRRLECVTQ
jgi:hypothetical protein